MAKVKTEAENPNVQEEKNDSSMDLILKKMEAMEAEINSLKKENDSLRPDAPNPIKPPNPAMEELVTIQLFKDKNKYKDDVFIAINGERIQVQRGVPVQIKAKYAKVLERSVRQDAATADLIAEETERYERASKLLG